MIYKALIFSFAVFLLASCNKKMDELCTAEFRMVTVQITDDGTVVLPDEYTVTSELTNEVILTHNNSFNNYFTEDFVIFTDSEMQHTNEEGRLFRVKASKNNVQIMDEVYDIAHDNCHVILNSGNTAIELNP